MKIPAIKKAVENYTVAQLQQAEAALLEEQPLPIEIEGVDEGEKLTHILAALFVKEEIANGNDLMTAVRAYSQRVRNSIS